MVKTITLVTLIACLVAFAPATASAAQQTPNLLSIPVTGTGTAGTLSGVFNLTSFAFQNGQLLANGTLTGTVTAADGTVTSIVQTVSAAVSGGTLPSSCNILHLVLGPITLNLLGLQITTNQIVLDITAIPGAGNLLGNLLCDVANLLNNPSATLANLLNQILAILRNL